MFELREQGPGREGGTEAVGEEGELRWGGGGMQSPLGGPRLRRQDAASCIMTGEKEKG